MKGLVAATCLSIIAFVAYFFGNMVWQDHQAKETERSAAIARADRRICLQHVERQLAGVVNAELLELAQECVLRGLVGPDDIQQIKVSLGR